MTAQKWQDRGVSLFPAQVVTLRHWYEADASIRPCNLTGKGTL